MSHLVEIANVNVVDTAVINNSCLAMGLSLPVINEEKKTATVRMPAYPGSTYHVDVVFDLSKGTASVVSEYKRSVDLFLQRYAIEACKLVAASEGKMCAEHINQETQEICLEITAA